jgi:alkylated DNA repair dioxygenase AlkB
MRISTQQPGLFDAAPPLPPGLLYAAEFISPDEERQLVAAIGALPLKEAKYKSYTARRRVLSFGSQYDFDDYELKVSAPIPPFLHPLRNRVGNWLGLPGAELQHALITEYRPGTPLGWHRDVPDFAIVAGISLAGWCRMRFRPYAAHAPRKHRKEDVIALDLAPRSAYLMRGAARWQWQHSVSATRELRYSITFRTLNREAG